MGWVPGLPLKSVPAILLKDLKGCDIPEYVAACCDILDYVWTFKKRLIQKEIYNHFNYEEFAFQHRTYFCQWSHYKPGGVIDDNKKIFYLRFTN